MASGGGLKAKPQDESRSLTLGMKTLVVYGRTAQNLTGWSQSDEVWVQVRSSVIKRQNQEEKVKGSNFCSGVTCILNMLASRSS